MSTESLSAEPRALPPAGGHLRQRPGRRTLLTRRLQAVLLILIASACSGGAPWIPPDCHLPDRPPLLPRTKVQVKTPAGTVFRPTSLVAASSLNGKWRFSGLESSATPFRAMTEAERDLAALDHDDSDWGEIRVPLNWYRNPSSSYDMVLKYGHGTDSRAGATYRRLRNPYFKGWYRHSFTLPTPLPERRVLLRFDAIGYAAELFVNGKRAGRHHGDFVPFSRDITDYVSPGQNLVALRVLSDFGPTDSAHTRTYGAAWGHFCFKGGLWLPVTLVLEAAPRVEQLRLTTDPATGGLRLDYTIMNHHDAALTLTPGVAVTLAEDGQPPTEAVEFPSILLRPGANTGTLGLKVGDARPWSPDAPHLYYCTLYLRDQDTVVSARLERFGFRDFKAKGTGFTLNGKPIYLFIESAHSVQFGGYPTPDGHATRPRALLTKFRRKGYNMLRTAHMPVAPEVLDIADELGIMIYNEWSFSCPSRIDEGAFEPTNLSELRKFVMRDHNHPSVVMWSLGNEVEHRKDPALPRQLDKQTALVRRLDLQERPIAAFAGVGNVVNYGTTELDTDVIDYHLYTGITKPWTQWNSDFQHLLYEQSAKTYGTAGQLNKPIVISECVGGGWGLQPNPAYEHGDIDEYLAIISKPYGFGNPGAAGYSGAVGVKAALDPGRSWGFTQTHLGSRIVDLIRQDQRIAGFAPWIAYPTTVSTQWTQPVYAGLRANAEDGLMPRQFMTPGALDLEAFVSNQSGGPLRDTRLVVELAEADTVHRLEELDFPSAPDGKVTVRRYSLVLPETGSGAAQFRLTVYDGNREIGRNYYDVTLHPAEDATRPILGARKVALLSRDKATEKILRDLKIPYGTITRSTELNGFQCAVIPPRTVPEEIHATAVREWVENGGRLLVLEQDPGSVPAFPEYQVSADYNSLVEIVVAKHPAFDGLLEADFDIWAENPFGNVVTKTIIPLNATALAVKGSFLDSKRKGTGVAEATVGRGRVLLSQLEATELWGKNGAATRYLRNILGYVTTQPPYPARTLETKLPLSFSIVHDRVIALDLSKQANRDFTDRKAGDGVGGWTDQGNNDFRLMPLGQQVAAGIPFSIIDPSRNSGRACIALRGSHCPSYPAAVRGIPVNAKVASLYFLHALGYGSSSGVAGTYRVNYADGSHSDYALKSGVNIDDWWEPARLPRAIPGIVRTNALGGQIGLYVSQWVNHRPDVRVESIDCLAARQTPSVPLLVAVTAERTNPSPLTLVSSHDRNLKGPGKLVAAGNADVGPWCSKIDLPASDGTKISHAMFFLSLATEKLKGTDYHYLSFDLCSGHTGQIDIVLPESGWRSTMMTSVELGESHGKWIKVRLSLDRDFIFTKDKFALPELRHEFWIYNGRNKAAGYPRRAVSLKITNVRLE